MRNLPAALFLSTAIALGAVTGARWDLGGVVAGAILYFLLAGAVVRRLEG